MKRLLHVNASPRGDRSRSGMIATQLLSGLSGKYPGLEVEHLDLFETRLPPFDSTAVEGRYLRLMGDAVPSEQTDAWAELEKWTRHFLSFDGWLFATPMWNFGLPYPLKHYVDVLTHPGLTFTNDAQGNVTGLAAGKRAIIVAASAMPFGTVAEIEQLDFQLSYLKTWLGFIGVSDRHAIRVAGTFGPDDAVAAAMAKAVSDADALIAQL